MCRVIFVVFFVAGGEKPGKMQLWYADYATTYSLLWIESSYDFVKGKKYASQYIDCRQPYDFMSPEKSLEGT